MTHTGVPQSDAPAPASRRHAELLDRAYTYVLEHGLADLSLRPLATAIGSSPRVLLYLFGSKEDLVRTLLARARAEHLRLVAASFNPVTADSDGAVDRVEDLVDRVWPLLSAPDQLPLVRLVYEAFFASLRHEPGPWAGFAEEQIGDWLDQLRRAQPHTPRPIADARATTALALVRGLLLDLLATHDTRRIEAARATS